jgi:hypothetical protein
MGVKEWKVVDISGEQKMLLHKVKDGKECIWLQARPFQEFKNE